MKAWAVIFKGEYCFTWDKKHPEEKIKKSDRVFAIYPTRRQAREDVAFRGLSKVRKIELKRVK